MMTAKLKHRFEVVLTPQARWDTLWAKAQHAGVPNHAVVSSVREYGQAGEAGRGDVLVWEWEESV